ncbi:TonB-dependent receptor plug domain protein [Segatella salivae DSM 15606]|uniref:TonB-dependent receptor plug domain protein n=2 Tax=Segatella salivae TaxID=228604 RepID=E6MMK3_9BACT|nr:TonB-dependent receptor plug domain protein [Segatella salivae DSM 15606]
MQKKLHLLMALMLFFTTSLMAQVTTSSINGKVVAGGETVIGATVTAVHVPSGTTYNAVTNTDGRYTIQGMRVGGPYKVTISYIGFKDDNRTNIFLALGEPTVINADMKEDAKTLTEVTVTGRAGHGGNGAASNFSKQMIENAPTVDRNVYDVAKLSPLVNNNKFGGISIAGTNNRYNSFQIDGMVSNDVFGLTSSGTNGGQTGANPISMDAIEQIQVAVSPFDVRQSGFTGGAINAITKSGTNKFTGTAFTYYTDENLYGRYSQVYKKTQKLSDESTKTYGFTFGGPIIKDKLFFFTSLEYKKNSYPSTYYAGAPGYFMNTQTAQQLVDIYKNITGIEESFERRNINQEGTSLLGRLDWNINNKNHFTLRYQGNFSYADKFGNGKQSFFFNNSSYRMKDRTNSFVAELTSHISNSLYNEFRLGLTSVRDKRATPYSGPTLYFSGDNYTVNMGTEYSSGVNSLDQDIWTLEDNFSIYSGNHNITVGTHNEFYDMKNGFIQAAFGNFAYNFNQLGSVDRATQVFTPTAAGFLNNQGIIPNSGYQMKYSDEALTGTTQWRTPFKAGMAGIYVQDKWDMSTAFQLTYGIRFDIPFYSNKISINDKFNATDNWAKTGVVVGRRPASCVMVSPRVGFRWFMNEDHTSLLRGGVGIFNGRAPFVWIENAWANTGMEMRGINIRSNSTSPLPPNFLADGGKTPDQIRATYGNAGGVNPDIVTIDRHFKFPQAFRANLAWEQQLPYGVKMTLEALYSRQLNAVWFNNIALQPNGDIYARNNLV